MTSSPSNSECARVAVVTAGAGGLGRCIAELFLASGYRVHVCDVSQNAIDRFLESNPKATATLADVGDCRQVDLVFQAVRDRYDRLDVLVNNAGIAGPTAVVEDIQPEEWDRTVAVDLSGAFYCTRLAVPLLKASGDGGSIVNISSNAAFFGFPLRSPYTASKWALIGLTKTWAMELGSFGIRVNAICPGSVQGPRIDGVIEREADARGLSPEAVRDTYLKQSSMRVFVEAKDVAQMALHLCSSQGASISGQAIGIDGHTENLSSDS